jgi:enamine deaminase RidA (YjgF/YER057c/UK114 family)
MIDLCLEHGVKLLVYGTIAGGFLTEQWLGRPEPDSADLMTYSQMKYRRFIEAAGGWGVLQKVLRALYDVAQKVGASMANVASRYILDQPAVGGVIIGARLGESEHIEDNLRLFEFALDQECRTMIEDALATKHAIPGDCGDEYRKPPFLTASGDLSDHLELLPKPWVAELGEDGRTRVCSGTPWEKLGSFSRAVRVGNRILVSGTTSTRGDRVIGGDDVAAQLHFVIDKIEGVLQSLDSSLDDVVCTRVYIRDLADWEVATRVHGARLAEIQPANTLVQANLVGDEYLVEMEAEAEMRSGQCSSREEHDSSCRR